jgi:hypothetical protein
MARKKGSTTLDTMLKMVLLNYDMPTRKDIEKVLSKIDRLEKLVKTSAAISGRSSGRNRISGRLGGSASDAVLEVIRGAKNGIDFDGVQQRLGLEEKKLRNIIFRLNKLGRIKRKSRGMYIAV